MDKSFEHSDLAGATFHKVNLGAARFDDVNLSAARFTNVSLAAAQLENISLSGASIRNASLANVDIRDTDIRGLRIHGFAIDKLIEAEQDRQDPVRLELRVTDPHEPEKLVKALRRLSVRRAEVLARLAAVSPAALAARPARGRWSALEHLRHLLFADEMYLKRWIRAEHSGLHPFGLVPAFLESDDRFANVGSRQPRGLDELLAIWTPVEEELLDLATGLDRAELEADLPQRDFGTSTLGELLAGMIMHQWLHLRLAQEAAGPTGGSTS